MSRQPGRQNSAASFAGDASLAAPSRNIGAAAKGSRADAETAITAPRIRSLAPIFTTPAPLLDRTLSGGPYQTNDEND
ncbi:hypothetical protein DSM21852_34600 [Methylocystis bryophila]|nr:hypothetical protein DSM21852_34600 [Methylocystis bryophila]